MKRLLLFFIAIALYSGCKKYPDGPLISLRTKEHRVAGQWTLSYFSINGYDSTSYLQSKPLFGYYFMDKEKDCRATFSYFSNDNSYSMFGNWEFLNNKKAIHLFARTNSTSTPITGVVGPYGAEDVTWEIMRLKEKEMWLKTFYDGREYFVKFIQ